MFCLFLYYIYVILCVHICICPYVLPNVIIEVKWGHPKWCFISGFTSPQDLWGWRHLVMRPDKYSEHMCLAERFSKDTIGPPNCNCPSCNSSNCGFVWTRRLANMSSFQKPGAKNGLVLWLAQKHVTWGQVIWPGILLVIPLNSNEQTFASRGGTELGKASTRRTSGRIEMRYRLDGRTSVLLVSLAYSFKITIASWGPKASW